MSNHASFVTEPIWCDRCRAEALAIMGGDDKYLTGALGTGWAGNVISGVIGGLGTGAEFLEFEWELVPKLSAALCHPLRVAVMTRGSGTRVYVVRTTAEIDADRDEVAVLCWEAGLHGQKPPGIEILDPEANRLEFDGTAWVERETTTEATR